jgi:hypothetical protein
MSVPFSRADEQRLNHLRSNILALTVDERCELHDLEERYRTFIHDGLVKLEALSVSERNSPTAVQWRVFLFCCSMLSFFFRSQSALLMWVGTIGLAAAISHQLRGYSTTFRIASLLVLFVTVGFCVLHLLSMLASSLRGYLTTGTLSAQLPVGLLFILCCIAGSSGRLAYLHIKLQPYGHAV